MGADTQSAQAASSRLPFAALVAIILLLAASAFFIYGNLQLSGRLSALSQNYTQLSSDLDSLQSDYSRLFAAYSQSQSDIAKQNSMLDSANSQIALLSYQLNQTGELLSQTEQKLQENRNSLEAQKQAAQQIASDLSSLQQSVNDSIYWYKENAQFPSNYSWEADIYLKRVLSDCVENNALNLGCMSYLMANSAFAIHYRTDLGSAGKLDFLQSVKQTIDLGWGDCKDYSLLFKAALNSIRARQAGLQAVSFAAGTGNFYIYPKQSEVKATESYWYVPNAEKAQLGPLDSLRSFVICYRLNQNSGHCTVALSDKPISSSSEIGNLQGARVFEPQIGSYLGIVGQDFSICSQPSCVNDIKAIQIVISDDDLYKYQDNAWVGYSDYLSRINYAQAGLGQTG
jgi:hypothetical protein